jgi:hypothetical protein
VSASQAQTVEKRELPSSKGLTLRFAPLTPDLLQSYKEFNTRLSNPPSAAVPNRDRNGDTPAPMEVERYVAVDGGGAVRGAYLLRWQSLWLRGREVQGAALGYPISEGIIDKRYAMVGVSILRDAVKRCKDQYVLGGGGRDGNVFRIARHTGWQIADVPFRFRVLKARNLVRQLPQTQHGVRRIVAGVAANTGLAQLGTALLQAGSALRHGGTSSLRQPSNVTVEIVRSLADAAEDIWPRVKSQYTFCVVRNGAHVEPAFPPERADLRRLIVRVDGSIVGWAVVMTESLSRLKAFLGDVNPGLIVDAFGDTSRAGEIVRAATAYLASQGVDVVITNSSHHSWLSAYKNAGFLSWHSQFPLIVSQSLACRIGDLALTLPESHMSRGDGDGVHYLH